MRRMQCLGYSRGYQSSYLTKFPFGNDTDKSHLQKTATSPGADLEDMQSLFYLVEEGDAYAKAGKLNLALKRFHTLVKVSSNESSTVSVYKIHFSNMN
jgi:hypothetical protein